MVIDDLASQVGPIDTRRLVHLLKLSTICKYVVSMMCTWWTDVNSKSGYCYRLRSASPYVRLLQRYRKGCLSTTVPTLLSV